jgi:hypothetical protein
MALVFQRLSATMLFLGRKYLGTYICFFLNNTQPLETRVCAQVPQVAPCLDTSVWETPLAHNVNSRFTAKCIRLNKLSRFTTTKLRKSNLSSFERFPKLLVQMSSSHRCGTGLFYRRQRVPTFKASIPNLLTMCLSALLFVCHQTAAEPRARGRYCTELISYCPITKRMFPRYLRVALFNNTALTL